MHNGSLINDLVTLVDELTYRSYARNRRLSPDVTPERWAAIYPDAELSERQFQRDEALKGLGRWHEWRGGCEVDYDA